MKMSDKNYNTLMSFIKKMDSAINDVDFKTTEGKTVFVNLLVDFGIVSQQISVTSILSDDYVNVFEPMSKKLQNLINQFVEEQ